MVAPSCRVFIFGTIITIFITCDVNHVHFKLVCIHAILDICISDVINYNSKNFFNSKNLNCIGALPFKICSHIFKAKLK